MTEFQSLSSHWEGGDFDVVLPDAAATHQLGEILGRSLPAGSVLLLEGQLGSGKTTLVQGMGVGLGIADPIVSPTFTLVCEYLDGRIPLYHFDLYRLSPKDMAGLVPEIYWEGQEVPPGLVVIEWANRLGGDFRGYPGAYLQIALHLPPPDAAADSRRAVITPVGQGWEPVLSQLSSFKPGNHRR
ncbi:MAG: tRNA (adenosine(37)-N6)-threonylcarbamoyltransferase complex ATPase subunit type 1 TsaE [Synechococcales bacterium]|nr:tRNA (adenosine(37)-N6)-threonylcarbamoyltransferase complex ATPase subunit type 1 TsaE [Synechococcales bacterium]